MRKPMSDSDIRWKQRLSNFNKARYVDPFRVLASTLQARAGEM